MNQEVAQSKYGYASFGAAIINTLLVNFAALMFVLWAFWGYQFYLPFFVVDVLVSVLLVRRTGFLGQVGRGMLIGCVSVPVSLIVFTTVFITAKGLGPL